MTIIETTGGDIIITTPNCDCGLTGGCEKCRPIISRKYPKVIPIKPSAYEEYVFYRRREIAAHPEWGVTEIGSKGGSDAQDQK